MGDASYCYHNIFFFLKIQRLIKNSVKDCMYLLYVPLIIECKDLSKYNYSNEILLHTFLSFVKFPHNKNGITEACDIIYININYLVGWPGWPGLVGWPCYV